MSLRLGHSISYSIQELHSLARQEAIKQACQKCYRTGSIEPLFIAVIVCAGQTSLQIKAKCSFCYTSQNLPLLPLHI